MKGGKRTVEKNLEYREAWCLYNKKNFDKNFKHL